MLSELLFQAVQGEMLQRYFAVDMVEVEERALGRPMVYDFVSKPDLPSVQELFGPRRPSFPVKAQAQSVGVITSAQSLMVQDGESGMTLLGRRSTSVRPIGSVTKLMAAMVFLDQEPDLEKSVTLIPEDFVGGGRVYLAYNDALELGDVLAASMIGSDNTATQSLARHLGWSEEEFVARMNEKAEEIGMNDTVFTDPTGILTSNQSTAVDLVRMLRQAESYPELRELTTTFSRTVRQESGYAVTIENTNGLLDETSFDLVDTEISLGKTGYLPQAGYVLATVVERAGHKVYVVVMGSESKDRREIDTVQLTDWVFNTFEWPSL